MKSIRERLRAVVTLRAAFWGMAAAVLLSGVASVGSLRAQQATARQNDRLRAEGELRTAQQCVSAWSGRADVRDGDEATYRKNANTLISFASSADPARLAAYRAQVERDVAEIRAKLPDPECDLAAARRRLEQGDQP